MNYILFICGHNAGRSQMAQAFFNFEKRNFPNVDANYEAMSAGTRPGDEINPAVVEVMKEIGIVMDDTSYFPKPLTSDSIVSKGSAIKKAIIACDDSCELPVGIPRLPLERWNLPDPNKQPIEKVRALRTLVKGRILDLLNELESQLK